MKAPPLTPSEIPDPIPPDLVAMFLSDLPDTLARLKGAQATHSAGTIRMLTQQLQGTAALYGYSELACLASSCTAAVRLGQSHEPHTLLLIQALQRLIASSKPTR